MWKPKFEQGHKRMKVGLLLLIVLSILLSAGVYFASLVMLRQVSAMQSLIPVLAAKQNILNELSSLRNNLDAYKKEKQKASLEKSIAAILQIKDFAEKGEATENIGTIKSKFYLISVVVGSFSKDITVTGLTDEQKYLRSEEMYSKISGHLSGIVKFSELEEITSKIRDNANNSLIISFLVFIFIGGGLFLGSITYSYLSAKQIEKIDEMVKHSMVDELTKLYNIRYFEERLLESINRVERFKEPLAVLFMRVELPANMEKEAKEMVLKEVALRLSKNTRIYDVNARFEEYSFASIIYEVAEKETNIVIKRIKAAMEQKEIAGKIGVSRGFIGSLFNFGPRVTKNYQTYVRVVLAAELYKSGRLGVEELLGNAEALLDQAETAKNQVKLTVMKGKKISGY